MAGSNLLALLRHLALLATILSQLYVESAECQLGDAYYKLPDPFEGHTSSGFFAINSFQVAISANKKRTQTKVTEYFSLKDGLTFSRHRDQDDPSKVWALIGDGQHGKTYLVLNPESRKDFQCELDHAHNHKHVFPWQYVYDEDQHASDRKRDRNSDRTAEEGSKRFVYGVGGVWLNAIQRKLVSNEVDEDSPYPYSNLWVMREGDLDIKLLFEKPKKRGDMEKLIASSKLEAIQIKRQKVVSKDHDKGNGNLVGDEIENITIESFVSDITYVTSTEVRRFFKQLARCRQETEHHRLFPSLMKALSLSPKRLYAIEYLEKKYGRSRQNGVPSGSVDESRNRHVWDVEFNSEWFSLLKESQLNIYEGLPDEQTAKGERPNDNGEHEYIAEIFLKKFTENEKARSSRHSTVSYHFIEEASEIKSCKVADMEPLPSDHLMIRPVHFHRDETDLQLTGKLTGLGALIMNVADIHYKQYNLFKKEILVANDEADLYSKTKMTVDEWQIYDQKTGRNLHFYFREKLNNHEAHEITDLVRIDIRDAKAADVSDGVIEKASEDNDYDADMMVRFDIINFKLDEDDSQIELLFTVPQNCNAQRPDDSINNGDDDDDSEKSDDEDSDEIFNDDDDYGNKYDSKSDGNGDEDQMFGENFELDAGRMMESFDFPDFFEFLDSRPAYGMTSKIEIDDKKIILREQVDVEKEWAIYSIYHEDGRSNLRLDDEYYVNYKSELIFRIDGQHNNCEVVDQIEPWFRLISQKMTYLKSAGSGGVTIESNKLHLYGLGALWRRASDSLYTDFIGMRKDVIDEPPGHKFKPVLWSMMDDGDNDMELEFTFLWNLTRFELDSSKKRNRRPFEMLAFDSVQMVPPVSQDGVETNFKEFKMKLNSFTRSQSKELFLPMTCRGVLMDANRKEASESEFRGDIFIPSLFDYLGPSDGYNIKYSISHTAVDKDHTDSIQAITESYDLKKNRGKITVGRGEDTVEIFIDGANKAIYSFARNICKRITTIKTLVDLGPAFSAENDAFDLTKMWGLAALWIRISKFGNAFLRISHQHDHGGNLYEVRDYRAAGTWWNSFQDVTKYTVLATFNLQQQQASGNFKGSTPSMADQADNKPVLNKLDFIPEQLRGVKGLSLHRSRIYIKSISRDKPPNWDLPEPCNQLSTNTNGSPDASEFPGLRKYVQFHNRFHMRSEVTLSRPMMNEENVIFLTDEWLYNKNVRLTTYGLNKNVDLIVYGDSMELFDVSLPYRCPSTNPRFGPTNYSPRSDAMLKKFWNDDVSLVEMLSNLFYGPTSLWWLAEKNIKYVKLENSFDIAPKPNSKSRADSNIDRLAKEMRTEVWKVTSPPNSPSWSYHLHFEKYNSVQDGQIVREWHILQRVELEEPDTLGMKKFIEIDIINYSWDQSRQEMTDRFLLPEGYGCTRNPSIVNKFEDSPDILELNPDDHFTLSYEATLELLPDKFFSMDSQTGDYFELKEKLVSPTLIGTYVRSGPAGMDFYLDVSAHYNRVRYHNGTMTSTKTVYDNQRSLIYEVDRLTGYCRIGSATSASKNLKLAFPLTETHKESVEFDQSLFELLFLKAPKKDMLPLNRYMSDGKLITTYEQGLKDFRLTDNLNGYATLTRRYASSPNSRQHNSMSVQILMLNEAKTKLRAIFNIAIQMVRNTNLAEVIEAINVAQCYNDGDATSDKKVRSFAIDYRIEHYGSDKTQMFSYGKSNQAEIDFIKLLMKEAFVLPTQLDGIPRMEHSHKGLVRLYFNLVEKPTAIEYCTRRPGYTMSDKIAKDAEIKLVSSVIECSKWCDQLGCIVMSYCGDRTCRVVTDSTVDKAASDSKSLAYLLEVIECVPNPDCVHFSKIAMQARTLEAFSSSMDVIVNSSQDPDDLARLSLRFGNSDSVKPVAFHDLKKNLRWITEDTDFTDEGAEAMTSTSGKGNTYKLLKLNHKIDITQLTSLKLKDLKGGKFEGKLEMAHSYNECLSKCKLVDCTMTSYCRQDDSCVLITGTGDVKRLEFAYKADQASGCSITVQDFLASYSKFEDTRKPISFEHQLDDYSALECAAACRTADKYEGIEFNCLSFDYCVSNSADSKSQSAGKAVCYLQRVHVMQDYFDRTIFDSSNLAAREKKDTSGDAGDKQLVCDHYSKSVLADYDRIANRKFMGSNSALRGSSADRCALDCQEDDECWAFEYCYDGAAQPAQSCYFIRTSEVRNSDEQGNWRKDFEKLLQVSKHCSVYTFKHNTELYQLDRKLHTVTLSPSSFQVGQIFEKHPNLFMSLLIILSYFAGAVFVGSVIQLAFMRIRGGPLLSVISLR